MSGSAIQALVYGGYASAAAVLGTPFSLYRPQTAGPALAPANLLGTINAAFSVTTNYDFSKPSPHGKPLWNGLFDGSQTLPGDYLTDGSVTHFIAAQQALQPIETVECNAVLSFLHPASNSGVGSQPYGGDTVSLETPVMTAWPGSLLQGTKGEKGELALPGDVRMPWFAVLVPAFAGAQIQTADVMSDDLGRRFKVSGAEFTGLGWRLTAILSET